MFQIDESKIEMDSRGGREKMTKGSTIVPPIVDQRSNPSSLFLRQGGKIASASMCPHHIPDTVSGHVRDNA